MSEKPRPGNRNQLSRVYSEETWRVYEVLDQSLDPRGPDSLYQIAGEYLTPGSKVLDAGCRDAAHLIHLVETYDVTGVGVDPVSLHIERAQDAIEAAGAADRITVIEGVMQDLPYADGHFDFVWCRDVIEQVDELEAGLKEVARTLRPGGVMLAYTVFVTEQLESTEAKMLDHSLGNVAVNLVEANVEAMFVSSGLSVERKELIGTEWPEYAEERTQPGSRALLRLSRLRRKQDALVEKFGQEIYEHVEANLHWELYQFLGKLMPTLYILRREEGDRG